MELTEMTNQIEKRLKERGHTSPKTGVENMGLPHYEPDDEGMSPRELRMKNRQTRRDRQDARDMIIEEMAPGDLVDFGGYGKLYILKIGWGDDTFWVTSKKHDRYEPDAAGWYIKKRFAKEIIERG